MPGVTNNSLIFSTIRPWLDATGFTPERITKLDDAIARLIAEATGEAVRFEKPLPAAPIVIAGAPAVGERCFSLIKEFEGLARVLPDGRVQAYPDPGSGGDPWTIGYGSTGPDVKPGTIWTKQQCEDRMKQDVSKFAAGVIRRLGGAATSQGQLDAMVSLAYNIGLGNFEGSTLLRKHKAGDYVGAKMEFGRWNKAAGKVMQGLVRRRAAEASVYGNGAR